MKKILFLLLGTVSLTGCALVNPPTNSLTKDQATLDLSNNQGVVLFTLHATDPNKSRLSLASFTVREMNQYKYYNTLGSFDIPLSEENYSAPDNLYYCAVVLGGGIYRLVSFSGMPDLFLSPFTLKCDKIFDIYPSRIHYLGRLEFGEVNTQAGFSPLKSIEAQSGCTPLKGIADSYEQDVDKFKAMFPVLRDKKIDKDTFY